MGWSTRVFLLSADDTLHRIASAAFHRMLRHGSPCRLPAFAGQRLRQASVTVDLAGGVPLGVRHLSYSVVEFDADGALNVKRLNAHQVARVESLLTGVLGSTSRNTSLIEAASRFIARGGTWSPDDHLRKHIEAAAMGRSYCRRAKTVG